MLPYAVPLHLKLVEQASISLLKSNGNHIHSLYIMPVAHVFSSQGIMSLSFPMLETLTIESSGYQLSGHLPFQPDTPNLARLRLLNCYVGLKHGPGALWLQSVLPKIKHLELHNVRTSAGDDSLGTLLKQCAGNLESIIINPRDIVGEATLDFADFQSLKHVTLQTSPNGFEISSVKLPSGLMYLAIWQVRPKNPKDKWHNETWWEIASSESLRWASRCLESAGAHRTPLFKAVTLFAVEEAWMSTDNSRWLIEETCKDLGVELFAELWKLTPPPD